LPVGELRVKFQAGDAVVYRNFARLLAS
jgi:hypothetical protein